MTDLQFNEIYTKAKEIKIDISRELELLKDIDDNLKLNIQYKRDYFRLHVLSGL